MTHRNQKLVYDYASTLSYAHPLNAAAAMANMAMDGLTSTAARRDVKLHKMSDEDVDHFLATTFEFSCKALGICWTDHLEDAREFDRIREIKRRMK